MTTTRALRTTLAATILMAACSAATLTVTRTQSELQEKLAPRFPVTREKMLVTVTLSDPKVLLRPNDARVGLDLAVNLRLPLRSPVDGRIAVAGEPSYDPEQKAFFLRNPHIERLDFPGFDLNGHEKTRAALDAAVSLALASTPVYKLEGQTWKQATARHLLKEVHVADGKLSFTLGP